ncbi:MAG: hypothetical protein RBT63_05425 [Bdellovibrionales bacterium]|jgi:cbb3-type cytochrome oxidase subunit 3|nr:hypothetical protein [Bdellovibrionales bacterium]
MKQLAVTQFPLPIMTVVGLLIFFLVFLGIAIWTYRIVRKETWNQIAELAIADAQAVGGENLDESKLEVRR